MAKKEKNTDSAAKAPKKKERVNKDIVIRARVTSEERARFEKKAAERGFSTVSEMIRSLIEETSDSENESE